jgi:MFS superfamily sulfate permease-like transporter
MAMSCAQSPEDSMAHDVEARTAPLPALFESLRGYTRHQATADIASGVIVGIVALPLAIAFAIASGLSPERGLFTAIVAGFLISALGGSRVQIGGPTGAFVVIVYGIVQQYGVGGLTVATMMAGVILVVFGLARLGAAIKFIPFPVTLGFTSGIAVVILATFLFMRRMSEVTNVTPVTAEFRGPAAGTPDQATGGAPAGVEVYEINGPFFFGAAEKFRDTMGSIALTPRVLLLRMRDVTVMDSTGIHALRQLVRRSRAAGTLVLLSELRSQPLVAMDRAGILDEVGEDALVGHLDEAFVIARRHMDPPS